MCVWSPRRGHDLGTMLSQCSNALKAMGFTHGMSSPCLLHHAERDITVVVHGDDSTAMATDVYLDWYTLELEQVFEIKVCGRLGEGNADQEVRILNRVVRITPNGVVYEADPRHHELLTRSLGLEGGTSVLTPGVKPTETEQYTFKGELNAHEGPVMDVTGRVSHASMDSSGIVTLASDDGTDTVRATALDDLMSATMQATSATEALSPKEKRNIVIVQPLTQRHRNTSKQFVSLPMLSMFTMLFHIVTAMVVLLDLLLLMSMLLGFRS